MTIKWNLAPVANYNVFYIKKDLNDWSDLTYKMKVPNWDWLTADARVEENINLKSYRSGLKDQPEKIRVNLSPTGKF